MSYCEVDEGQYIIKQDDDASCFFLLEKGHLEVHIGGSPVRRLSVGEGLGELALLYNAPRSASCYAVTKCFFWMIDRSTFRKAVEQMITQEYTQNRKFIEKVTFFQNLTSQQKDAIAGVLIDQRFPSHSKIVNKDDAASSFYIIKEGCVGVISNGLEVRRLGAGESFGETALLQGNQTRTMSVCALENTTCLALGRDVLTKLLGEKVEVIIYRNISKWALEKAHRFKHLTINQLDRLIDTIVFAHVKKHATVAKKGELKSNTLFIVLKGALQVAARVFAKPAIVNSEEIFTEDTTAAYEDHMYATENSLIGTVNIEELSRTLNGSLKDILQKNLKVSEQLEAKESQIRKNIQSLVVEDLQAVKKLGNGQFGSVYLVKQEATQQIYALKCVAKASVVESSLERHIMQEKHVMQTVNFPFIMRFFRSFKDDAYIYFLLEFIQGQELFEVIREIGLLSSWDSQFFVGSIILALEYLHSRKIIYRDIKPENIMITHKGYLKLIDMGTAKIMMNPQSEEISRTFTIIGTPHYMAPEIISGKGYCSLVDLWSVGICLYEFMSGYVPFGEDAEDPYEIYEEIVKKEISFPKYFVDLKAKALVEQLLSRIPEMRLGGSYNSLKGHPFFQLLDWTKLADMSIDPPFFPPNESYLVPDQITKAPGSAVRKSIAEESGPAKLPQASKVADWDSFF